MPPRLRADRLLVERGLFESRAKAQAAIAAGLVTADERAGAQAVRARSPSTRRSTRRPPSPGCRAAGSSSPPRSTGSASTSPAASASMSAPRPADSTEVLLARGARRVYAVDVGTGQLHPRLRGGRRSSRWKETDIRALDPAALARAAGLRHHRRELHLAQARPAGGARAGRAPGATSSR